MSIKQTLGAFALSGLVLATQVPEAIADTQKSAKLTVGELLKHDIDNMPKGCLENTKRNYENLIGECIAHYQLLSFSGKNFLEEIKKIKINYKKLILENPDFFGVLANDVKILEDGEKVKAFRKIRALGDNLKPDNDIDSFITLGNYNSAIGRYNYKIKNEFSDSYELLGLLDENGIKLEDFIKFVKGILPIK